MKKRAILIAVAIAGVIGFCFFQVRGLVEPPVSSGVEAVGRDELDRFISEVKERLVYVEGGRFLMGDFGVAYGEEGLPFDPEKHSSPLHEVILSSYYMDRYKVTNRDFDFYLRFHGQPLIPSDSPRTFTLLRSHPRLPAPMDWFEADSYCAWLADITALPFSLATEAQWEYAARSRGKFLMVTTDDGTYKYQFSTGREAVGVNISSFKDREDFADQQGWRIGGAALLPVDRFPPNPLGIYSMSDNGREWLKDWYDPEYYKNSPLVDPQGPEQPAHSDHLGRHMKVMRGQSRANEYWTIGINVYRMPVNPNAYGLSNESVLKVGGAARCVVNSGEPLK